MQCLHTYQRMMMRMFKAQLDKNVKADKDDMVVKSKQVSNHLVDLDEIFSILRKHKLRLSASKCSFSMESGKFLGCMIIHRGIEVNPDQIKAIHDLQPPCNPKEVQHLTKMTGALNRFIYQLADRCRPFFQLFHWWKDFSWSKECDRAFEDLNKYLAHPSILSKPKKEEVLYAYIVVTDHAMSL